MLETVGVMSSNERDERARRAADEIITREREERAAKTARLREARLVRESQHPPT